MAAGRPSPNGQRIVTMIEKVYIESPRRVPAREHNGLALNLAPVQFLDAEVNIGFLPYESKEQLKSLRLTHRDTHLFKRRGGTKIVTVPFMPEAPQIGEEFQTVRLLDDLYLSADLIHNALVIYLASLPRTLLHYYPLAFLADENLLKQAVGQSACCPEWLTVNPLYEAEVRVFHFDREEPFVGVCFNMAVKKAIRRSCDLLLSDGLLLENFYVGSLKSSHDDRLAPRFELAGRVKEIEKGLIHLVDSRPGSNTIPACEAILEPSWKAFHRCLTHYFTTNATAVESQLDVILAEGRMGPTRRDKLSVLFSHFSKLKLEMLPGIPFSFGDVLSQATSKNFPLVEVAPKPIYVFDPTGSKTDTWHDRGVDVHGPYTSRTFTPNRPRICVICQTNKKGRVEQFVRKFLHGISLPSERRSPFAKGFVGKYALEDASVDFFMADDDTPAEYQRAVQHAVSTQTETGVRWNLALVQVEERFHSLHGTANPYLVSKSDLMTHQIPVQEFLLETTEIPDRRLGYVLNNMGLATYAKLGGIPWLLKADRSVAHELIIGLGSTHIGPNRLGNTERVVGITTVFSGDGNYCLSTLSQAVPFENYRAAVLESLDKTIRKIAASMNWQASEHVRLVFHSFKPFKRSEAEAVQEMMSGLGQFDTEYAFLHIADEHPYMLFDENQPGVHDYESSSLKGMLAPLRGSYLSLSRREMLMVLTGAREVKRANDGIPRPILLRLDRASTFEDMTYLTRQAFAFACHSWRSYFPSPLPVTIMYSELIARLLGNLGTMPQWNPTVMVGRIGETRWFL